MLSKLLLHRCPLSSKVSKIFLLYIIPVIISGHYLPAQALNNDRVIIRNYKEEERVPTVISDLSIDEDGTIWMVSVENILSFDGTRSRALENPIIKGNPILKFSSIVRDGNNKLLFISRSKRLIFRLSKTGHLYFDSTLSAYNLPPYDNYHYFNWDWFINHGSSIEINKDRQGLKNKLFANSSFLPFNDSTFIFTENNISRLYKDNKQYVIKNTRVAATTTALINNELVLVEKDKLVFVNESNWEEQEIALTGDILADSIYKKAADNRASHKKRTVYPSISLFNSAYPHIVYNNKLYRIEVLGKASFKTIFVCDLSFLHYPITKIEYRPGRGFTAIGTQREGLFIIRSNPFYFNRFSEPFATLRKERIFFPLTIKDKTLFLTPWSEFSGNGYSKILDSNRPGSQSLFVDHTGTIWEGIENKIIRYDHNMVKQEEATVPDPNIKANDFCENDKGELFCLTDRSILKYENGVFKDTRAINSSNIKFAYFQMFRYIKNGLFWISSAKGIYAYTQGNNQLDKIDSIPDDYTLNITKLKDGSILFSCLDKDYYYYYYRNRFFRIYTSDNPGLDETMSITEDQRGRIWIATSKGLYVTSTEELKAFCDAQTKSIYYYKYNKGDGLPEMEFNGGLNPSNAISEDGYLALNSMAGVLLFHQDSIKPLFPSDDVQLTSLLQTGGSVLLDRSLVLEDENKTATIQASIPYYGSRINLKLEYKIEGAMDAWMDVNDNGRISISHLRHGTYRLSVRVRTGLGPRDFVTRDINISVMPLFYQKIAFKILSAIFLLTVCILAVLTIVRQRKEIGVKNTNLRDKNEELRQMVSKLRENIDLREKMISLIIHDLKSPLYAQSLILNYITAENYFNNEEGLKLFQELKNSSASIIKFINDFLTWYSSQKDGFIVEKTKFEHIQLVDDLFSVYAEIAARKKLELNGEAAGPILLFTDKKILEIILRNLLDNAIKYTASGHVMLHFENQAGGSLITIADTGRGMSPDKLRRLNAYAKKPDHESLQTFGYRFIYTLAEKIDVSIQIVSELNEGTRVSIFIPHDKVATPSTA